MAEAVSSGQRFKEMYIRQQTRMRQAKSEKGRMIDVSLLPEAIWRALTIRPSTRIRMTLM